MEFLQAKPAYLPEPELIPISGALTTSRMYARALLETFLEARDLRVCDVNFPTMRRMDR